MRISYWSSDVCSSDLRLEQKRFDRLAHLFDDRHRHAMFERPFGGGIGAHRLVEQHLDLGAEGDDGQRHPARQIGRASCRDRVCQYVKISVVAVSFKTKQITPKLTRHYTYTTHH